MSRNLKMKACTLAVALATLPFFAEAAGMGRLNVRSALGQPLKGEIELISVQADEAETLQVKLASPEAHSAAKVPYPSSAMGLSLVLEKRPNGQYVVDLTSSQAINEPILDLVVELRWATGQVRRGYSVLLDPADLPPAQAGVDQATGLQSNQSGAIVGRSLSSGSTKAVAGKSSRTRRGQKQAVAPAAETEKTSSPDATSAAPASSEAGYTVKAGDTLSSVARTIKPEGVNLDQVLVSLYKKNESAFDGNMNRLKRGKILQIPSTEEMQAVSKNEAAKEIRAQSGNWGAYRRGVANQAEKAPVKEESAGKGSVGTIKPKMVDQGATTTDKKDVLKLSGGKDTSAATQARIKALEDEKIARQKQLDDANQRVSDLNEQIRKMEAIKLAKPAPVATPASVPPKATQPEVTPPVTTTSTAADVSSSSAAASAPIPVVASVASVASDAEVASAPQAPAKPKKPRVVTAPPPEETSFIDMVLDNPLMLAGGGAGVLVLIGGLFMWSRRRGNTNVFENSIITGGDLKPNTVLGRTGGGVISTQAENSFLTDFSRQGLGAIDTDEVDPIAEADVYMAYGRDAQAEEILKDALAKDPSRQEIRGKLLDIYAARKDKTSFEEVAADLYSGTRGEGGLWEHAAHLGRSIDSENPLYSRDGKGQAGTINTADKPAAAPAAGVAAEPVASYSGPTAAKPTVAPGPIDFEFDLNTPSQMNAFAEQEQEQSAPVSEPVASAVTKAPESVAAAPDANMLDFGLDLDSKLELPALDDVADESHPSNAGLMELDLPVDTGSPDLDFSSELSGLDLDLNTSTKGETATLAPDIADFDAEFTAPELANESTSKETSMLGTTEAALDLNFDFNLGQQPSSTEAQASTSTSSMLSPASGELSDMDFGLTAADLDDLGAEDPVQTKIDLARAYMEMGDIEGAREMLQEAVQEGSAEQQSAAKKLLSDL